MQQASSGDQTGWQRWLGRIERWGNALPHPATLFALLAFGVVLASAIFHALGVSARHPASGETIMPVNLLSVAGLHRMVLEAVRNFLAFPPLGISLVALMGIGLAEYSGLMSAALRQVVLAAPRRWITPLVVFAGVLSNAGSEVGYVLLTPLAAALFHAMGRHPLLGLAAAFAGVSGGYSANLLIGSVDVLLAGLTQAAAQLVRPDYRVTAAANWYFLAASSLLITLVGTWITEKVVAPRLGDYRGAAPREPLQALSVRERRALWAAAGSVVGLGTVVLAGLLPAEGFLNNPGAPGFTRSVFMEGLVTFLFLFGLVPGLVYGWMAGTLRSDHDVVAGMVRTMQAMATFIVLAFFAAQFIAYFNWTRLGLILAVKGAGLIEALNLRGWPILLMAVLVLFAAAVNLLISSASAKWALLAPVFVPMFMLLGFSPELVQAAFRVGDSVTNIVTPLMSYFPLILTFAQRYEPQAGLGTLIALMIPYSAAFLVAWLLLTVAWIALGIPVGPGVPLFLDADGAAER